MPFLFPTIISFLALWVFRTLDRTLGAIMKKNVSEPECYPKYLRAHQQAQIVFRELATLQGPLKSDLIMEKADVSI